MFEIAGERLQVADSLFEFAGDFVGSGRQVGLLLLETFVVAFELLPPRGLMPDGGFETGDRLAVLGQPAFGAAKPVFGSRELAFGGRLLRLAILGLGCQLLDPHRKFTPLDVDGFELGALSAVVVGGRADAQSAKFLCIFSEFGGFRRLRAHGG